MKSQRQNALMNMNYMYLVVMGSDRHALPNYQNGGLGDRGVKICGCSVLLMNPVVKLLSQN